MWEQADTEFGEFFGMIDDLVHGSHADADVLVDVLRPLGVADHTVSLVEGDLTVSEALTYARGLAELGFAWQAEEVLSAVYDALDPSRPLSGAAVGLSGALGPVTAAA